jgi:CHASE3 domain sensor protein
MPQDRWEQREQSRRRAERKARESEAVDEDALEDVIKAAGAKRSTPEARRALRALAEREVSRVAARAAEEADARDSDVDEECIAIAARAEAERRM